MLRSDAGRMALVKYLLLVAFVQTALSFPEQLVKGRKTNKLKQIECGENESHMGCDQTCADIVNWSMRACRPVLDRSRCFCRSGYLRNDAGRCVPRARCPQQQCPDNSHFDWCGGHHCASYQCDPDPKCFHGYECIPGCKCKQGFFRHANGTCTPKSACPPPPTCPENEQYYPCLGCYEETCRARSPMCVRGCVSKGCFCAEGFVRNDDGKCVTRESCPDDDAQEQETWTWDD